MRAANERRGDAANVLTVGNLLSSCPPLNQSQNRKIMNALGGERDDPASPVPDRDRSDAFAGDDPSWWSEFLQFVRAEKKWWLVPMVLSAIAITVLTTLSVAPVAPFIYTLF